VVSLGFAKGVAMQMARKQMKWASYANGQTRSNNDEKRVF